jgi:N-acetylneuraminate synthase
MSANHNGSKAQAREILLQAKANGADAVKMQTYTPETITLKTDAPDFVLEEGLWKGRSLYDLYQEAHMPWEWNKGLFEYASSLDLTLFSSPFDSTAVDHLEDLNCPAYKIASFELVDLPLIKYVASTGKPMILSTGMASLNEIREAVAIARQSGCSELVVLHCVSGYPTPPEEYNLATMTDIRAQLGVLVGLSDHTLDNTTALASVAMGACLIEKHFTLDRAGGGPDDSFSLEPEDLKALSVNSDITWSAIGSVDYSLKGGEKENIKFRRSLYFVNDLRDGQVISESDIKSIRPGYGLPPRAFNQVIGKKAKRFIRRGTPVTYDDME